MSNADVNAINLALLSLLKISHPVMSAVSNLIIPAVAHARAKAKGEAFAVFIKQAAAGAALLIPLFVPLLIVPSLVLKTVYAGGNAKLYSAYSGTMQAMALSYVLIYLANMTTAYLTGLQKSAADKTAAELPPGSRSNYQEHNPDATHSRPGAYDGRKGNQGTKQAEMPDFLKKKEDGDKDEKKDDEKKDDGAFPGAAPPFGKKEEKKDDEKKEASLADHFRRIAATVSPR